MMPPPRAADVYKWGWAQSWAIFVKITIVLAFRVLCILAASLTASTTIDRIDHYLDNG